MSAQQSLLANVSALPSAPRQTCSHCGQLMPVTYSHNLSAAIAGFLWALYKTDQPSRLRDLNLSTTEYNNAQKARYFGLVYQVEVDEKKNGKWALTAKGKEFLRGENAVDKKVFTRKIDGLPTVVDREGSVRVWEVSKEIWERMDYIRNQRAA